jgi:mannosyltransferase
MNRQEQKANMWILLLLLALSLALRLYRLNMSFWMDEIITITEFVSKPWLKIITEVPYPNNHILYTLLAKLSITVFGEHEWSARLPAMIMGTLIPPAAYLIFRKRFSEFVAAGAGLFLALNFWSIWFSQDARGYSAYILFALFSTHFFLEWLEKGGRRLATFYLVCAILLVWFYLYGFFIVAAQGLWLLGLVLAKKQPAKKLALVFAAAVMGIALYLPGLPQIWEYANSQFRMSKMHGLNLRFLTDFLGICSGLSQKFLVMAAAFIALLGLFLSFRKWPVFFMIYFIACLGIVLFSGLEKLFIYPRFLSFFMPVFAVLVMNSARGRIWRVLFGISLGAMLLINLAGYYIHGKEGFKDSAQYLSQNHQPNQIICYGIICKELGYYYKAPMTELDEDLPLTPDLVKGKVIISRKVDWTNENLEFARRHCIEEKVWPSSGYKENTLWLLNCP